MTDDDANDDDASSSSPSTAPNIAEHSPAARIPPPPPPPRSLAPIPFNAPYPDPTPITEPDPSARTLHDAIRHFRIPPPPPRPGSPPPENPALRTFVLKPIKVLPMVRAYAQTGYTASELPSSSAAQDPAPGPNDDDDAGKLRPSPYDIKKLYNGPDKSFVPGNNRVPQGAGIYRRDKKVDRCMRYRDIPGEEEGDCLWWVDEGHAVAFGQGKDGVLGSKDGKGEEGWEGRYVIGGGGGKGKGREDEGFTHIIRIHHGERTHKEEGSQAQNTPIPNAEDPSPTPTPPPTSPNQPITHHPPSPSHPHTLILSLLLTPNPVSDVPPTPPKRQVSDAKLASMYEWMKPSGLGVSMDKLRDILMPTEDVTDRQNMLNLTAGQVRALRSFHSLPVLQPESDSDSDSHSPSVNGDADVVVRKKRVLILTPRDRRTDGMAALVTCIANAGTSGKARQVIAALDAREDCTIKNSPWKGVLEMSMAGRLDADTLF